MIVLLHTFEDDISFLFSLLLFHAYVFFFISLPVGTPRNKDTSEDQNGQRAHVCIKYAFGNKRNFRTGTHVGRASQVKGIPTLGG